MIFTNSTVVFAGCLDTLQDSSAPTLPANTDTALPTSLILRMPVVNIGLGMDNLLYATATVTTWAGAAHACRVLEGWKKICDGRDYFALLLQQLK